MNQENIRTQFINWVKNQSDKDPAVLHELVLACLDDAVEQIHGALKGNTKAADPAKDSELMKQVLDYWSSNVYVIMERGIASDNFRNVRMPIPAEAKTVALKEFYAIRNECYSKYFN